MQTSHQGDPENSLHRLAQENILNAYSAMVYTDNRFSFGTDLPLPDKSFTRLPYHSLRHMGNVRLVLNARHSAELHGIYLQSLISIVNAHNEDVSGKLALQRLEIRLWTLDVEESYNRLATFARNDLECNVFPL